MYVLLINEPKLKQREIPLYTKQYESSKYIFKKKNVNMLHEHWSYNYAIDLEKGIQPPFDPIYNLSQYELSDFYHLLYHSLDDFFHVGFVTYSSS